MRAWRKGMRAHRPRQMYIFAPQCMPGSTRLGHSPQLEDAVQRFAAQQLCGAAGHGRQRHLLASLFKQLHHVRNPKALPAAAASEEE